jgi:hypothetical protein
MKRITYIAIAAILTVVLMNSCKDDPVKPIDKVMSIKLLSYDSVVTGSSQDYSFPANAVIQNVSSTAKDLVFKMEIVEKTEGHNIEFCAFGTCLIPDESGICTTPVMTFAPGQIEEPTDFHASLLPYGKMGTTKAKFTASVVGDPEDKVEFYITFIASF